MIKYYDEDMEEESTENEIYSEIFDTIGEVFHHS